MQTICKWNFNQQSLVALADGCENQGGADRLWQKSRYDFWRDGQFRNPADGADVRSYTLGVSNGFAASCCAVGSFGDTLSSRMKVFPAILGSSGFRVKQGSEIPLPRRPSTPLRTGSGRLPVRRLTASVLAQASTQTGGENRIKIAS